MVLTKPERRQDHLARGSGRCGCDTAPTDGVNATPYPKVVHEGRARAMREDTEAEGWTRRGRGTYWPRPGGARAGAGRRRCSRWARTPCSPLGDLVVKVGRDAELLDRARRELDVAQWLAEAGVPAVRAAASPRPAGGRPPGDVLAPAARRRPPRRAAAIWPHCYGWCTPCPPRPSRCRRRELLGGVERWLRLAGDAIDPADAAYLRARRDGFAAAAAALDPASARRARSTATRCPAMCMSAPTARSWSTWRPSPPICASTTWSSWRCPATATGCPPRRTTPSPRSTAGMCATWEGCAVLRGRPGDGELRLGRPARAGQPGGARRVPAPGRVPAGRGPEVRWYPF